MTLEKRAIPSLFRLQGERAEHLIPAEHILFCRYLIIHYCTIPIISILYILYNNDFKKTCDISNKDII